MLIFCIVCIWFPLLNSSQQECIYKLQKRIVRSLCNVNFTQHCMPLFKAQGILMVKDLLLVKNAKLLYKLNNNLCPSLISQLFNMSTNSTRTWGHNLLIPKHCSTKVNKSFLCKSIIDWRSIKSDIKTVDNCKRLVKLLKRSVIDGYWSRTFFPAELYICCCLLMFFLMSLPYVNNW